MQCPASKIRLWTPDLTCSKHRWYPPNATTALRGFGISDGVELNPIDDAARSSASPALINVWARCEVTLVSDAVTSNAWHRPNDQGMNVTPSGCFMSSFEGPRGSLMRMQGSVEDPGSVLDTPIGGFVRDDALSHTDGDLFRRSKFRSSTFRTRRP